MSPRWTWFIAPTFLLLLIGCNKTQLETEMHFATEEELVALAEKQLGKVEIEEWSARKLVAIEPPFENVEQKEIFLNEQESGSPHSSVAIPWVSDWFDESIENQELAEGTPSQIEEKLLQFKFIARSQEAEHSFTEEQKQKYDEAIKLTSVTAPGLTWTSLIPSYYKPQIFEGFDAGVHSKQKLKEFAVTELAERLATVNSQERAREICLMIMDITEEDQAVKLADVALESHGYQFTNQEAMELVCRWLSDLFIALEKPWPEIAKALTSPEKMLTSAWGFDPYRFHELDKKSLKPPSDTGYSAGTVLIAYEHFSPVIPYVEVMLTNQIHGDMATYISDPQSLGSLRNPLTHQPYQVHEGGYLDIHYEVSDRFPFLQSMVADSN